MKKFIAFLLFFAVISPIEGQKFELSSFIPAEMAAVEEGKKLGIGSVWLEGPAEVKAYTYQSWTLHYVVGESGMKGGGGIRIGMRHSLGWSPFQISDADADGYITAELQDNTPIPISLPKDGILNEYFLPYFPWQNMFEVNIPEPGLEAGDTLLIHIGDTREGSKGMRIQPWDEFTFVFKCYVDVSGNGRYLPLSDNPSVKIKAADPYRLSMLTPSNAVAGKPTWCLIRAEDRYGNPTPTYRGSVRIQSKNKQSGVDITYDFKASDKGVHRFNNVVFETEGTFRLSANDGEFNCTSNPVKVSYTASPKKIYWGDLHGHTLFSDGRGSVEQYYEFARNIAGLDFCAVTDHGFEVTDKMWQYSKKVTNRANDPGNFITLNAYEWSGMKDVGGDHNVYYLDDDPPIYRSRSFYNYQNYQMYHGKEPQINHVEDLFKILDRDYETGSVFCIPHFGGRRGNPKWHDPEIQRSIEVFSEHRRSEDWMKPFLKKGQRLGIIASSDGHYGNPGYGYLNFSNSFNWEKKEIGMALVAVYAEELTRKDIFSSLYNRHTYATTGERIILDFRVNGKPMGSEIHSEDPPMLSVYASGTNIIERIEIKKNNQIVKVFNPEKKKVRIEWKDTSFSHLKTSYYYVRIVQSDKEEAISSPVWIN